MIIVPTLHPAALTRSAQNRGSGRFQETVIGDLAKALSYLWRSPPESTRVIHEVSGTRKWRIYPTLAEVCTWLDRARGRIVAVDIETTGESPLDCRVLCIGFAYLAAHGAECLCLPVLQSGGGPYWNVTEQAVVLERLRAFLVDPHVRTCFHNGTFDVAVLTSAGFPVENYAEDTILGHHVIDAELPHSLAYCSSTYLEIPYWKDDAKGDGRWIDLADETLRVYNLTDCIATAELQAVFHGQIDALGVRGLYEEELALNRIFTRATLRGLYIDPERRHAYAVKLCDQRAEALGVLQTLAGEGGVAFNPSSPVQLQFFLYSLLGFPVVLKTAKSGAPATNKDALALLTIHAEPGPQQEALLALSKWRRTSKAISTWTGEPIGSDPRSGFRGGFQTLADGCLHPSWRVFGTHTGRLASTGVQNLPKAIQKLIRARPGCKLVGADLSQAELRVIAYLSGDPELLQAYERKLNLHTVNTTLIFGVRNPGCDTNPQTEAYLTEAVPRLLGLPYLALPAPVEAKWSRSRRLAKNVVFGSNYRGGPETLHDTVLKERDPDTDALIFPDIKLADLEAAQMQWFSLHQPIQKWWEDEGERIRAQGFYRCPLSQRIRWFKAGFVATEMANAPIQGMVASFMNQRTVELAALLPEGAEIIVQTHDALTLEAPEALALEVAALLGDCLNRPFDIPGIQAGAVLPCDPPKIGDYLNEV